MNCDWCVPYEKINQIRLHKLCPRHRLSVELMWWNCKIYWWNITDRFRCRLFSAHFFSLSLFIIYLCSTQSRTKKTCMFRLHYSSSDLRFVPQISALLDIERNIFTELHECDEIVMNQRIQKAEKSNVTFCPFGLFSVWFSVRIVVVNEFFI